MLEKNIERYLKREIEAHGGITYKLVSPQNVGVPDRIVIIKGRVYFLELKTVSGKLSKMQRYQITRLRKADADVRVLYGVEDVKAFIEEECSDDSNGI